MFNNILVDRSEKKGGAIKTFVTSVNGIIFIPSVFENVSGENVKQTLPTILFVAFSCFSWFGHFEAQLKPKIYDFLVLPHSTLLLMFIFCVCVLGGVYTSNPD